MKAQYEDPANSDCRALRALVPIADKRLSLAYLVAFRA